MADGGPTMKRISDDISLIYTEATAEKEINGEGTQLESHQLQDAILQQSCH